MSLVGKKYTAYRSEKDKGGLSSFVLRVPELGPKDILLSITHSGVCHTDVITCSAGMPVALGHEGVGVVQETGSDVTQFNIGDRAGGGFHKASCGHCKYCLSGKDMYCYERVMFMEGDFNNGTFSEYYIGRETFLHRIPDQMASDNAAALQCAGATVYTALKATVTPGKRVGILGIGGLGHLAIQFAAKMGAEVVVYSTTADKELEAREYGALEFYHISQMVEKQNVPIDLLIISGTHYPDWDKILTKEFLARDGVIVPLSAPVRGPIILPADPVLFQGYHLFSSLVASRGVHDEMLRFAAQHNVKPRIQKVKHEGVSTIKEAFGNPSLNKVRYRVVLEM